MKEEYIKELEASLLECALQLEYIRGVIVDGLEVGYNPLKGDWVDNLFKSQYKTTEILEKLNGSEG